MRIATHNGPFHADEVFATVVLQSLFPDAEFTRTRDKKLLDTCDIVYDVGGVYDETGNRFDHHMSDFDTTYENGILLSSLGLIWRKYGKQFCDGNIELSELLLENLVMPIDALDNGQDLYELTPFQISPITLQDIVKSFYPPYGADQDFDNAFERAREFADIFLSNLADKYKGRLKARDAFLQKVADSQDTRYVVLDEALPYGDAIESVPDLLYIIFPGSSNNDYIIRAVQADKHTFAVRRKLPEAWAGLEGEALAQVCDVPGAKFCHRGRWIAGADDLESALKMVAIALQ